MIWFEKIARNFEVKNFSKKLKVVENLCEVCFDNFFFFSEGPTIVNVNLYVRSFEKIDDVKMVSFSKDFWP